MKTPSLELPEQLAGFLVYWRVSLQILFTAEAREMSVDNSCMGPGLNSQHSHQTAQ